MELGTLRDAFDRVTKRQKLSAASSYQVVDHVKHEAEQALLKMQSGQDATLLADPKDILMELKNKLMAYGPQEQMEGAQKELNTSYSKYLKLLEKYFNPDISKACREINFDVHLVNQIVATHLFQQSLFDEGDCFVNEAKVPDSMTIRSQLLEMSKIREAMKVKNVQPALDWVSTNREKLKQGSSDLEMKLHQLLFVEVMKQGNRTEALNYAKTHIAPFAPSHMDDVRKCMSCILWIGRLESCPYAELLDPTYWDRVESELFRQFCKILSFPQMSPLSVTFQAGTDGLPTLLKLSTLMTTKTEEWQAMKQLPVPLDLRSEFQFHSVFVCPVSRDQGTEENPVMLLPCGHVLCKQSLLKMSKNTRTFKCPYCPVQASVSQCRQLHF